MTVPLLTAAEVAAMPVVVVPYMRPGQRWWKIVDGTLYVSERTWLEMQDASKPPGERWN